MTKEDVEFYWNNRPYLFDPRKKYFIYYRGCFCPPTRGHFSLIEKFVAHPNVTVFISQMGSEQRHGIPRKLNRDIWQTYIQHAIPKEYHDRIILKRMYGADDIIPFLEKDTFDRVIYLKGNERKWMLDQPHDHKRQRSVDQRRRKHEKTLKNQRSNLIDILHARKIGLDFVIIDRPLKGELSATKFVEAVKRGEKNKKKLAYFMPPQLPRRQQKEIVKKLRKHLK